MLPGFAGIAGAGLELPNIAYLSKVDSVSDLSEYTFASTSLGVADTRRKIIAAIYCSNDNTLSSLTIGGVAATSLGSQTGDVDRVTLLVASVPSGDTGDVVATFAGTITQCSISLWRLINTGSATPLDTYFATDYTGTALTSVASGFAVGFVATSSTSNTFTWTGVTEEFDEEAYTAGGKRISGGSTQTSGVSTTITPTENTTSANRFFAAATFAA